MALPPRIEAVERFLAVLRALRFAREEPKNSNSGQAVEAFLKVTGLGAGFPWCAALVAYAGDAAFGTDWPLPKTASCQQLYQWAVANKKIVPEPKPGDLLLIYFPSLTRMAHVAIVEAVKGPKTVGTIEGNSNNDGSREGWGWVRRERTIGEKDRLVRWV